jgi:hypothetical protein
MNPLPAYEDEITELRVHLLSTTRQPMAGIECDTNLDRVCTRALCMQVAGLDSLVSDLRSLARAKRNLDDGVETVETSLERLASQVSSHYKESRIPIVPAGGEVEEFFKQPLFVFAFQPSLRTRIRSNNLGVAPAPSG